MEDELKEQVDHFNECGGDILMEVWTISNQFYCLVLGGVELMEGDAGDILERVKGINREYGYNHLY